MFITEKGYNNVAKIMTNGKKYIIKERGEEWDYLCFTSLKSAQARFILNDYVYRIVKSLAILKDAPIEELVNDLDDNVLPDREWAIMLAQVVKYSPRGYEFAKNSKRKLDEKTIEEIEKLNQENINFKGESNKKPIKR